MQDRKCRPVRAPLRAVDRERDLFPLDLAAGHEVAVLGQHVVAVGRRGAEVLLHARVRDVALHDRVLRPLLLLVPRDHFRDRERLLRRDARALDHHVGGALVEVDDHRPAGDRCGCLHEPGRLIACISGGAAARARHHIVNARQSFHGQHERQLERLGRVGAPVDQVRGEGLLVEQQPVLQRIGHIARARLKRQPHTGGIEHRDVAVHEVRHLTERTERRVGEIAGRPRVCDDVGAEILQHAVDDAAPGVAVRV